MGIKLGRDFYLRDTVKVARDLVGKELVHISKGKLTSGLIVEVEAYRGINDPACHAYSGKKTKRTEVMFEKGGRAYVFKIYGLHYCFNVVTRKKGFPEAVLIRALKPLKGMKIMRKRRSKSITDLKYLTNGPGKLTQAMGVDDHCNGLDLCGKKLFINRNQSIKSEDIVSSKRINVDYAGDASDHPWRFYLENSLFVSKP